MSLPFQSLHYHLALHTSPPAPPPTGLATSQLLWPSCCSLNPLNSFVLHGLTLAFSSTCNTCPLAVDNPAFILQVSPQSFLTNYAFSHLSSSLPHDPVPLFLELPMLWNCLVQMYVLAPSPHPTMEYNLLRVRALSVTSTFVSSFPEQCLALNQCSNKYLLGELIFMTIIP